MNIKISSINNLLKLMLILSISLAVVDSVSAQPTESTVPNNQEVKKDNNQQATEQNSNQNNTQTQSQQTEQEAQITPPNFNTNNSTDTKIERKNSEPPKPTNTSNAPQAERSPQNTDTQTAESFPILDSLIYIDLPIVLVLLLLWFLNKNKQQKQIDKLTKNQNKIIGNFNQFNEINNKLNTLDRINRQIIEKIQDNNQKIIDSEVRLRELLSQQPVNHPINHYSGSTFNSNTKFDTLTSDISNLNSIAIVDKVLQLIETYNQDKTSLSNKAIATVAETQESLNQKRLGNSGTVTLENTPQKKYWIIEEDNDYYLVPHAKIKIDEYNIKTLESLFDCSNFTSDYSDFQLVKPAKVSQLSLETWQLEEKGKLNFY